MDVRTGLIVLALCLLASGSAVPEVKRPEYLKLCARSDPKINDCLKNKLQDLIPHLLTGEPEVNLPSLEKVRLNDVSFRRDIALNVDAGISLSLSFLRNLASAEVENVRSDIADDRMKMTVDIHFPELHIQGYFRTNLALDNMSFINEGNFNLTLGEVKAAVSVAGKTYEKSGLKYLQVQHVRVRPDVGTANLVAKNQGDGYSTVVNVGAAIINRYWDVLYREYLPYIEEKWDLTMTELANDVLSKVPYDHLFPKV